MNDLRAVPSTLRLGDLEVRRVLARSPVMLPIPGTSSPEHLEENWAARTIALDADEVRAIADEAASQERQGTPSP